MVQQRIVQRGCKEEFVAKAELLEEGKVGRRSLLPRSCRLCCCCCWLGVGWAGREGAAGLLEEARQALAPGVCAGGRVVADGEAAPC